MVHLAELTTVESRKAVSAIIGQKSNPVLVEVGASNFMDTKWMAKTFPKGKIYAFEPLECNTKTWDSFMKGLDNAVLVPKAAGAKAGTASFSTPVLKAPPLSVLKKTIAGHIDDLNKNGKVWVTRYFLGYFTYFAIALPIILALYVILSVVGDIEWSYSSSLEEGEDFRPDYVFLAFKGKITVNVIQLDEFYKETLKGTSTPVIDFLWTDVQGHERAMLEGASETLKNTHYAMLEYGEQAYPGVSLWRLGCIGWRINMHDSRFSLFLVQSMTRDETVAIMEKHGFGIVDEL